MKKLILTLVSVLTLFIVQAQISGDFSGCILVGNCADSIPGAIRWTGSDFEGFNGITWVSLTGNPIPFCVGEIADVQGSGIGGIQFLTVIENSCSGSIRWQGTYNSTTFDQLEEIQHDLNWSYLPGETGTEVNISGFDFKWYRVVITCPAGCLLFKAFPFQIN